MTKRRIIHTTTFVEDAVNIILECAQDAIAARRLFRMALSGGNTPRKIYAALAQTEMPWSRVQMTFSDERCVPPEDAQSNFKMAREALFDAITIPAGNIFRVRGEIAPEAAAAEYESMLAQVAARLGEPRYMHDLLLLGMGPDGHTASLFPETTALAETHKNVVANFVPKFDAQRVTFTYPLINAARHVCFLVEDPGKAPIVEEILRGGSPYPAEGVRPEPGQLTWLLGF